MDWIVIPANMLIIFGVIYKVFELFVRKDERKMIINKIEEVKGVDLSGTDLRMGSGRSSRFLSLRIGMLVLGVGMGCFMAVLSMAVFLPYMKNLLGSYYVREMLSGACICFFGGLALVISYIIEHNARRKENSND